MDEIIKAVHNALPKMNNYLLREHAREKIDRSPEFMATVFDNVTKLFSGMLELSSWRVLTPEERIAFETRNTKSGININVSELQLVEYTFKFQGIEYPTYLYLPYIKNDMLVINGKQYAIILGIAEQVFARSSNGVSIRVIRAPVKFTSAKRIHMKSETSNWSHPEFAVTVNLHMSQQARKKGNTTVIHYLLCKFGLDGTLNRFGLTPDQISFVPEIGTDTDDYEYFFAKSKDAKDRNVYLKVRKDTLEDTTYRKLAANILFILTHFVHHTVDYLYDVSGVNWRILLGYLIYGQESITNVQSHSRMDPHIASVDYYLDPITQHRIASFGVRVNDIYDLLQYTFTEIDYIMANIKSEDLYEKRISTLEGILITPVVEKVVKLFYNMALNPNTLSDKNFGKRLKFKPDLISEIYRSMNVTTSPDRYGASWLTSCGIHRIRQSGTSRSSNRASTTTPESRFHPSIPVVETMTAFSGSNPSVSGLINPYLEITEEGGVIRPPYADEIDSLKKYLPY